MADQPEHDDFAAWVGQLADPIRAQRAHWHLVVSGAVARDSVRAGLTSANPDVRRWCTKAMDHLADADSFALLVDVLADSDPRVRVEGLHALACDRCKSDGCRPDAASVLPAAIRLLLHDPDRHVRAYAAELVGRWVHTHPEAEAALVQARDHDPAPAVRKKAGWYAPGGSIHGRTAPRPSRVGTGQR